MNIVGIYRVREDGEIKRMKVTFQVDKPELDLLVWSLEAFVSKSGGQSIHRFALDTLDGLKAAYKTADSK
jgi:hypothetical protein